MNEQERVEGVARAFILANRPGDYGCDMCGTHSDDDCLKCQEQDVPDLAQALLTYGKSVRASTIEECAKVAFEWGQGWELVARDMPKQWLHDRSVASECIAESIRSLSVPAPTTPVSSVDGGEVCGCPPDFENGPVCQHGKPMPPAPNEPVERVKRIKPIATWTVYVR